MRQKRKRKGKKKDKKSPQGNEKTNCEKQAKREWGGFIESKKRLLRFGPKVKREGTKKTRDYWFKRAKENFRIWIADGRVLTR